MKVLKSRGIQIPLLISLGEFIPGIIPRIKKELGIFGFTRKMSKLVLTVCPLAFNFGLVAGGITSTTAYADGNDKLPYTLHEVTAPDGVTLSVQEWGNAEGPAILFIHGYAQSHLNWKEQVEDSALTDEFRMITFDLRGHGMSDKPEGASFYRESERWAPLMWRLSSKVWTSSIR